MNSIKNGNKSIEDIHNMLFSKPEATKQKAQLDDAVKERGMMGACQMHSTTTCTPQIDYV